MENPNKGKRGRYGAAWHEVPAVGISKRGLLFNRQAVDLFALRRAGLLAAMAERVHGGWTVYLKNTSETDPRCDGSFRIMPDGRALLSQKYFPICVGAVERGLFRVSILEEGRCIMIKMGEAGRITGKRRKAESCCITCATNQHDVVRETDSPCEAAHSTDKYAQS